MPFVQPKRGLCSLCRHFPQPSTFRRVDVSIPSQYSNARFVHSCLWDLIHLVQSLVDSTPWDLGGNTWLDEVPVVHWLITLLTATSTSIFYQVLKKMCLVGYVTLTSSLDPMPGPSYGKFNSAVWLTEDTRRKHLTVIKFCLELLFILMKGVFLLEEKKKELNLNVGNCLHKIGGV